MQFCWKVFLKITKKTWTIVIFVSRLTIENNKLPKTFKNHGKESLNTHIIARDQGTIKWGASPGTKETAKKVGF